jgi:uncharacterized protein YdeI (YjbR/CyaY-like superfamily)
MKRTPTEPKFFATADAFRRWLEKNHQTADELVVGFYKKESGRPSITRPESVDQALCFGWIDGIGRSIDDVSYSVRFTPRKPGSRWSPANIKRAQELIDAGLMQPPGLAAFQRRDPAKDAEYTHGRGTAELPAEYARVLAGNRRAHQFFQAQPPGYRKMMTWYVLSAKKEETRLRRLQHVIDQSAAGRRIEPMRPTGGDTSRDRQSSRPRKT